MAEVSFPDVSGTTGWDGSTGGSDASSPYSSPADYTWTSGATDLGSTTITATNGAGLSAGDSLTIAGDSTAPTGQSVDLAAGPWYTGLSVPLTVANGNDTGSGLDTSSRVVERAEATLSNGSCDTFGSWSEVTLTGGADTTVESGNCYRYRVSIADRVGNRSAASPASADAMVDTTAPAAPSLTLSESSALSYVAGTTLYYNPQGTNSGTLHRRRDGSDAQSGIDERRLPERLRRRRRHRRDEPVLERLHLERDRHRERREDGHRDERRRPHEHRDVHRRARHDGSQRPVGRHASAARGTRPPPCR